MPQFLAAAASPLPSSTGELFQGATPPCGEEDPASSTQGLTHYVARRSQSEGSTLTLALGTHSEERAARGLCARTGYITVLLQIMMVTTQRALDWVDPRSYDIRVAEGWSISSASTAVTSDSQSTHTCLVRVIGAGLLLSALSPHASTHREHSAMSLTNLCS